jgi:hypothetical protein
LCITKCIESSNNIRFYKSNYFDEESLGVHEILQEMRNATWTVLGNSQSYDLKSLFCSVSIFRDYVKRANYDESTLKWVGMEISYNFEFPESFGDILKHRFAPVKYYTCKFELSEFTQNLNLAKEEAIQKIRLFKPFLLMLALRSGMGPIPGLESDTNALRGCVITNNEIRGFTKKYEQSLFIK